MAALLAIASVIAASLAWLAWGLPEVVSFTSVIAEACQSLLERCVEAAIIGKLAFFWAGALLALSGVLYALAAEAAGLMRSYIAVSRLPASPARGGVVIIRDSRVKAAFTHGILRPRIYISAGLINDLGRDELRSVFLHELEHRKRMDPLRFLAIGFLRKALFYLPAAGAMASAARLRSEHRADDAAARAAGPLSLASAMVKVARSGMALPAPSLAGSREQVTGRVRRLLEGRKERPALSPARAGLSLLAALAVAAAMAMPLHAGHSAHECTMERCSLHVEKPAGCAAHCSSDHDHT